MGRPLQSLLLEQECDDTLRGAALSCLGAASSRSSISIRLGSGQPVRLARISHEM